MEVELLQQHRAGDARAFADIVRRHTPWVYSLALRGCRDAHLAEDVVQAVFILLHRKGPKFSGDGAMIKWLHKVARYCAANATRSEQRRRRHQTEAAMQTPHVASDEWEEIAPLLDGWIDRLPGGDRQAILLRYYLDLSFADVAGQIHCTPEAARKRVDRAVEKLRGVAERKGFIMPSAIFAAGMLDKIRTSPPAGLIARAAALPATGSALAVSSQSIVRGASIMMTISKTLPFAVGSLAAAAILSTAIFVAKGAGPGASVAPPPAMQNTQKYATLSPFSALRWRPQVQVNGTWYELIAIDDQPVREILDFAAKTYGGDLIEKRFDEDLVEVLTRKGYPPGDTVKLQLRTLDTNQAVTLESVPMTRGNRNAIWVARHSK